MESHLCNIIPQFIKKSRGGKSFFGIIFYFFVFLYPVSFKNIEVISKIFKTV